MIPPYFRTKLVTEDLDGETWKLRYHLSYITNLVPGGQIVVPSGFITDLASIPRFFHRFLPKSGLHNYAAVVHDYLYSTQTVPKAVADKIFLEGMRVRGVAFWRAHVMYWAVHRFGFAAWRQHTKELSDAKRQAIV